MHAFACHGHQALAFEAAEILAELNGPQAEWARAREVSQFEGLRCVLRAEPHCLGSLVGFGHGDLANHFEHSALGFNAPSGGSRTRPSVAVEVLVGLAVRDQRVEVRVFGVCKANNRREARRVPTRITRAGGVPGVRAGEGMPRDVVEKMLHRYARAVSISGSLQLKLSGRPPADGLALERVVRSHDSSPRLKDADLHSQQLHRLRAA